MMGLILKAILTILVIATIIFCVCYQFFIRDPGCDPENQIMLNGFFRGYTDNKTYDGFTNIYLDNKSYIFFKIDKDYLKGLIGFNITLNCCKRLELYTISAPYIYYDYIEAYITDKS